MSVRILTGDCRAVLKTLPSESVDCVVTSPPYYGLRDYGTAQWDGGNDGCDHLGPPMRTNNKPSNGSATFHGGTTRANEPMGRNCSKCGAVRVDRQIGLEETPDAYVKELVDVFRECRRVLKNSGTLWLNLGDSYAGGGGFSPNAPSNLAGSKQSKQGGAKPGGIRPSGEIKTKDLIGIPWMVAFALRADGWYLRSDIIWSKPNPMPESVTDRPTKAHEYLFLLSKSGRYFYDADAIKEAQSELTIAMYGHREGGEQQRVSLATREARLVGASASKTAEIIARNVNADGKRNIRSVWTVATQPFNEWGETVRQVSVAGDADVDGKKRKASTDCPVHGDQDHLASNGSGGGRGGGRSRRSRSIDGRPVAEQLDGFAPIETNHEPATAQRSSDSRTLPCSVSANSRSTQSHRTDPAPETSPACIASAQTDCRTPDTLEEREPSGSVERTLGSSTSGGGSVFHPSAQKPNRIAHNFASSNSDCTCEWYVEIIEKTSHFATFPPDLIEPCIKAGSSERGCCAKCGTPWRRDISGGKYQPPVVEDGVRAVDPSRGDKTRKLDGKSKEWRDAAASRQTTGWSPSCSCVAPVVPATILDPFGGAGTTGLVADRLQRNAILIELNPDYAAMAERRIHADAPLFQENAVA